MSTFTAAGDGEGRTLLSRCAGIRVVAQFDDVVVGVLDVDRLRYPAGSEPADRSFDRLESASSDDGGPVERLHDEIDRAVELTGTGISDAMGSYDPNTNRPIVLLDFNRHGSRVFGDLTARIVGKKLATILEEAGMTPEVLG